MNQELAVLSALAKGEAITAADAVERWNIYRLAARVADLRSRGYDVRTEMVHRDGKRWAEYKLARTG